MIALARQHFCPRGASVPHLPKPSHLRSATATAEASSPVPLQEQDGRRPQRPGNQFALCAFFLEIPRQFTLENYRLATGSTAIIRATQELTTFSLNPLSGILFRAATGKIYLPVKNVWTMGLPCGSKRKTKN